MSTTQETFTLAPVSSGRQAHLEVESEPSALLPSSISPPPVADPDPEEDLLLMARSMTSSALGNDSNLDLKSDVKQSDVKEIHFLSDKDRQYIKALVVLGYRDDAARLIRRAYEKRKEELDRVWQDSKGLFSPFQIEYLEMLLMVGDRKTAISTVLTYMDEYQIRETRGGDINLRSELDREYEKTIRAIDTGGRLPPADDPTPPEKPVRSLFRRILHIT